MSSVEENTISSVGMTEEEKVVPLKTAIKTNLTDDQRIQEINPLIPPAILMEDLPLTDKIAATVARGRQDISRVLSGEDDRLVAVVGPCSIHDVDAALEYARLLQPVAEAVKDDVIVIMRVYFEKPRTTVGWKGLINDPFLDESYAINKGLRTARKLLLQVNGMGLPCAHEFLDMISPQFIGDLVAWGVIGARTTESQVHRELASGLSCPVGFKNGTMGNIDVCINALKSASASHRFLSVTKQGLGAIVSTTGNPACHTILRGGTHGPNFGPSHVSKTVATLKKAKVNPSVMVDCSHSNSNKIHTNQPIVAESVAYQVETGNKDIMGVMIESFLKGGRQNLNTQKLDELEYGVSITDACLAIDDTIPLIHRLAEAARKRRSAESAAIFKSKL